jgi:hypothetical protein
MKRKILLIEPNYKNKYPPIGLMKIATYHRNLGDDVKVSFNIKGTKWMKDGRENYITNLDAWRMETIKLSTNADANIPPSFVPTEAPDDTADDLPF